MIWQGKRRVWCLFENKLSSSCCATSAWTFGKNLQSFTHRVHPENQRRDPKQFEVMSSYVTMNLMSWLLFELKKYGWTILDQFPFLNLLPSFQNESGLSQGSPPSRGLCSFTEPNGKKSWSSTILNPWTAGKILATHLGGKCIIPRSISSTPGPHWFVTFHMEKIGILGSSTISRIFKNQSAQCHLRALLSTNIILVIVLLHTPRSKSRAKTNWAAIHIDSQNGFHTYIIRLCLKNMNIKYRKLYLHHRLHPHSSDLSQPLSNL